MTSEVPSEVTKPVFFGCLESVRGLAALMVVFYHLPPWFLPFYELPVIRHGYLMVNCFFVLSGFVLFHSYAGRIASGAEFVRFVALRLLRLYPVHLVCMLPFLAIELTKYGLSAHTASHSGSNVSLPDIGRALLANLFLIQGLGVTANSPSLNFPSWSISTEFYTYLVFACAVLFLSRRWFVKISIALLVTYLAVVSFYASRLGAFGNLLTCLAGFFAGCLTRAGFDSVRREPLKFDWPVVVGGLCVLALAVPWQPAVQGRGGAWYELLSFPASSLLILTLLLSPGSRLTRLLVWGPFRWLGKISYSLYMCHTFVEWVARKLCGALFAPAGVASEALRLSFGTALLAYSLEIALSLGAGWLCFRSIEVPSRELGLRFIARWRAEQESDRLPAPSVTRM